MEMSEVIDLADSGHHLLCVSYTTALGKQVTEAQIVERCAQVYEAERATLNTRDDIFIETTLSETQSGAPAHCIVYLTRLLGGNWTLILLRDEAASASARLGLRPESEEGLLKLTEVDHCAQKPSR